MKKAACDELECSSQAAYRLDLLGFNAARPPAFLPRGTARSVGVDSLNRPITERRCLFFEVAVNDMIPR